MYKMIIFEAQLFLYRENSTIKQEVIQ
jgi:hypothetical protein